MKQAVRCFLEKKIIAKRKRRKALDLDSTQYENLTLDPEYSKIFGFPDNSAVVDPDCSVISSDNSLFKRPSTPQQKEGRIKSNLASDRYQSMLAIGTSDGQIKIFNLKGYEQEIDEAHTNEITWVQFVPNKGILLSVDVDNLLKVWGLLDLNLIHEVKIPQCAERAFLTCLYIPADLTTQPLNHRHAFFGLKNGDVLLFDFELNVWSSYKVGIKKVFPKATRSCKVTDIKCHPEKMHRLLISYELTGVSVYSMNKDRPLYTLSLSQEKDYHKGRVLSIAWFNDSEFVIGYQNGGLEVYQTAGYTSGGKPRILNFNIKNLVTMRIEIFTRADEFSMIVEFQTPMDIQEQIDAAEDHLNETGVHTDHNVNMEVVLLKGDQFKSQIVLSQLINQSKDSLFLSAFGLFMLHEKYHTLNMVTFSWQPKQDSKKASIIEGRVVADKLKVRNTDIPIYPAFLFLALTKNLKLLYINLDSILLVQTQAEVPFKMTIFDRIYGQQSFIVASKFIPMSQNLTPYLACLTEFRKSYVQHQLNKVFIKDKIIQATLGLLGQSRSSQTLKQLTSDVEIHSSLSYNLNQTPISQQINAIIVTVDALNQLRVYLQMPEQTELLFKMQLKWDDPEDYAACIAFFMRAKAIVVSSKLQGQTIVINSKLQIFDCFGEESRLEITRIELFEHKNEEYFALGLRDGSVMVKLSGSVMNKNIVAHIDPSEMEDLEEVKEVKNDQCKKVTYIGYQQPKKLVIGGSDGRLTFYNMVKETQFSFFPDQYIMKQVVKVLELPQRITEVRQHLYYILTYGNLFVMSKSDHKIQQQFYKRKIKEARPRLLEVSVLVIQQKFSLVLIVEGGIIQMLDPFSLQAYQAYQLQQHSSICQTLIDNYYVKSNYLWGYGRRILFMAELDYETKGERSLFSQKPAVYEQHRQLFLTFRKQIKTGFFRRERNISQALAKHSGLAPIQKKISQKSASLPRTQSGIDQDQEISLLNQNKN